MALDANEFLGFAADLLGVPRARLSLETTYASLPEWDSMAHLRLVTEVAVRYGVEIPFAEVVTVTSLWEFLRRINGEPVKKAVAVDLDNTLWDGVVGEDGRAGIRPNGDFQKELKALKERGVLLVALSKNNPEDVAWFFGGGPGAILSGEDFVAWRTNWRSKAENLAEVAAELNLGAEAFVFVDDNPAERIEMAVRLPEVTVASFPPRLAAYFPERELTDEDRVKTAEYKAEALRKTCLREKGPMATDEIWRVLGCRADIHEMKPEEAARVAQLSQKANQFNVCTNRYVEAEVRALAEAGLVVTAHAGDRFGDQGLVGYVIVRGAEIVDFVMSCRAMGRGLENRIEREVEKLLAGRGVRRLTATWRATAKNEPVRDLFERLGFVCLRRSQGEKAYAKAL